MRRAHPVLSACCACALMLQLAACDRAGEERELAVHEAQALLAKGQPAQAAALLEKRIAEQAEPTAEALRTFAVALELAGDPARAVEHYRKAVAADAADVEAQVGLGRTLALSGRLDEAAPVLQAAVERAPQNVAALVMATAVTDDAQQLDALRGRLQAVAHAPETPKIAELQLTLADALQRGGDAAAAARAREQARTLKLGNPNVALATAELQRRKGRLPAAEHLLRAVVGAAPEHVPAAIRLLEIALELRHLDVAREALGGLPAAEDAAFDVLLAHARLALAEGRGKEGRELLARTLSKLPKDAPPRQHATIRLLLAEALIAAGEPDTARVELRRALERDPGFMRAHLLMADLHVKLGQPAAAVRDLKTLIAARPASWPAYKALAVAQRAAKDEAGAEQTLRTLLAKQPKSVEAHEQLAAALLRDGRTEEARALYAQALALAPRDDLSPLRALVAIELAQQRPDAAKALLERELEKRPRDGSLHVELGRFHAGREEWKLAERHLRAAVDVEPKQAAHWFALSSFYREVDDPARAQQTVQQGLALAPDNLAGYMQLAQLHTEAKQANDARRAYEKALELQPDFAPALNNLAMLLLDTRGDPARALALAQRAQALSPGSPAIEDTLGWAYHKHGDSARAVPLLQRSAERLDTAQAHYHLGLALLGSGQPEAGKAALRKALARSRSFEGANEARRALEE